MSDWREIQGVQNLRMANKILEQQGEINELRATLAALEQDRDLWRDRCDGQAWDNLTAERDRHAVLIGRLADDLEDMAVGACWKGNFMGCDNGGCVDRRALLAEARAVTGQPPATDGLVELTDDQVQDVLAQVPRYYRHALANLAETRIPGTEAGQ